MTEVTKQVRGQELYNSYAKNSRDAIVFTVNFSLTLLLLYIFPRMNWNSTGDSEKAFTLLQMTTIASIAIGIFTYVAIRSIPDISVKVTFLLQNTILLNIVLASRIDSTREGGQTLIGDPEFGLFALGIYLLIAIFYPYIAKNIHRNYFQISSFLMTHVALFFVWLSYDVSDEVELTIDNIRGFIFLQIGVAIVITLFAMRALPNWISVFPIILQGFIILGIEKTNVDWLVFGIFLAMFLFANLVARDQAFYRESIVTAIFFIFILSFSFDQSRGLPKDVLGNLDLGDLETSTIQASIVYAVFITFLVVNEIRHRFTDKWNFTTPIGISFLTILFVFWAREGTYWEDLGNNEYLFSQLVLSLGILAISAIRYVSQTQFDAYVFTSQLIGIYTLHFLPYQNINHYLLDVTYTLFVLLSIIVWIKHHKTAVSESFSYVTPIGTLALSILFIFSSREGDYWKGLDNNQGLLKDNEYLFSQLVLSLSILSISVIRYLRQTQFDAYMFISQVFGIFTLQFLPYEKEQVKLIDFTLLNLTYLLFVVLSLIIWIRHHKEPLDDSFLYTTSIGIAALTISFVYSASQGVASFGKTWEVDDGDLFLSQLVLSLGVLSISVLRYLVQTRMDSYTFVPQLIGVYSLIFLPNEVVNTELLNLTYILLVFLSLAVWIKHNTSVLSDSYLYMTPIGISVLSILFVHQARTGEYLKDLNVTELIGSQIVLSVGILSISLMRYIRSSKYDGLVLLSQAIGIYTLLMLPNWKDPQWLEKPKNEDYLQIDEYLINVIFLAFIVFSIICWWKHKDIGPEINLYQIEYTIGIFTGMILFIIFPNSYEDLFKDKFWTSPDYWVISTSILLMGIIVYLTSNSYNNNVVVFAQGVCLFFLGYQDISDALEITLLAFLAYILVMSIKFRNQPSFMSAYHYVLNSLVAAYIVGNIYIGNFSGIPNPNILTAFFIGSLISLYLMKDQSGQGIHVILQSIVVLLFMLIPFTDRLIDLVISDSEINFRYISIVFVAYMIGILSMWYRNKERKELLEFFYLSLPVMLVFFRASQEWSGSVNDKLYQALEYQIYLDTTLEPKFSNFWSNMIPIFGILALVLLICTVPMVQQRDVQLKLRLLGYQAVSAFILSWFTIDMDIEYFDNGDLRFSYYALFYTIFVLAVLYLWMRDQDVQNSAPYAACILVLSGLLILETLLVEDFVISPVLIGGGILSSLLMSIYIRE
ncbi:MAG: hypothetical protein ACXAB7_12855, partial [Candidatus Kariarchaeaceae archaeon]